MSIKVNEAGVKHAKKLIREGKVDTRSDWRSAQPTAEDGDKFIKRNDWKEYANWFLAIQDEHPDKEKQHYEFPYGDFSRVVQEGIMAAKRRAAQYKHYEIEKVADELLRYIEEEYN